MANGLKRSGVDVVYGSPHDCDFSVVWGERNRLVSNARNVLVMEIGYWPQDRSARALQWVSCGWNGLNGRADFCNRNSPADRYGKAGVQVEPWSHSGSYVLLIGQVPGDASHAHISLDDWYAKTIRTLHKQGLPVVFRPHPKGSRPPAGVWVEDGVSLDQHLAGALYAVTFNSTTGVEAALAGCRLIATDQGSMARAVAAHYADHTPPAPDRTQWLHDLAYTQWTADEYASGEAWQHIGKAWM